MADADDLFAIGLGTIPTIFRSSGRQREELRMFAVQAAACKSACADLLAMALFGTANTDTADWPDLLAGDYGTHRQSGETDAMLAARAPRVPGGVILSELLAEIQAILTANSIVGEVAVVELPRDQACTGTWVQNTGVGGTFALDYHGTGKVGFIPTVPFAFPPYFGDLAGEITGCKITFVDTYEAGNAGEFTVSGLHDNAALFTNASAVAGADIIVAWSTSRINRDGFSVEGFHRAYTNRGYRVWRGASPDNVQQWAMCGIIMILPEGTTANVAKQVQEQIRRKKAAGVRNFTEWYQA